jgi:hypothetical protein
MSPKTTVPAGIKTLDTTNTGDVVPVAVAESVVELIITFLFFLLLYSL